MGHAEKLFNQVNECCNQRWRNYNTNVLEHEYDYFEHA